VSLVSPALPCGPLSQLNPKRHFFLQQNHSNLSFLQHSIHEVFQFASCFETNDSVVESRSGKYTSSRPENWGFFLRTCSLFLSCIWQRGRGSRRHLVGRRPHWGCLYSPWQVSPTKHHERCGEMWVFKEVLSPLRGGATLPSSPLTTVSINGARALQGLHQLGFCYINPPNRGGSVRTYSA